MVAPFRPTKATELVITARRVDEFRIAARSAGGSAEAAVEVVEGAALPTGTAKWSAGTIDGCKTTQVVPAVPSAGGADVFQHSVCQDGSYVSAYTTDGILLWRHKIGASGAPVAASRNVGGARFPPAENAICTPRHRSLLIENARTVKHQRS
jgi:hypothetical protein